MRLFSLLISVLLMLSPLSANSAEQRIALVIGNSTYESKNLPALPNPANDAEDIARALRRFGFQVIEKKNLTLEAMNRVVAEFGSKLGGSDAALFYFAGHGIQVKGQNYLIPVNAVIDSEAAVPYQGLNVNQVLDEMDNGKSRVNIVILDACRNNPITGKFRSGQTRGLAVPGGAPRGTVIVYATDPGNVAADGEGRNGLFTSGLLTAFKGQDLSLDGILTAASAEVETASAQTQIPYVNGPKTVQKTFRFDLVIEPGKGEIEKVYWQSVERSSNPADFEAYLKRYPKGNYVSLAENRLKMLKTPLVPVNPSKPVAFDGYWNTVLSCSDTTSNGRLVKGYTLRFPVEVKDNRMAGQSGQVGVASFLAMRGLIGNHGIAEISVNGLTGNPDMSVGNVAQKTPYSYHMRGSFSATQGQATRLELRPCTANFFKN